MKNKIIFYSFRKVKWSQGCYRTLLLDIKCLRNTYRGLEDDLAFDVVRPGLVHPISVTALLYVFFLWLGNQFSKNDREQKVLFSALIKRRDFL